MEDPELLRTFEKTGSEPAFDQIVSRYIKLVYSTAMRSLNGDPDLSQDVTQEVFLDVARKVKSLLHHQTLTGWLYTSTRFASSKALRRENRRRHYENEAMRMQPPPSNIESDTAWNQIKPVIDEALEILPEEDRTAVLMRYFEDRLFKEIGTALGTTENTARMRVDRSLE